MINITIPSQQTIQATTLSSPKKPKATTSLKKNFATLGMLQPLKLQHDTS